MFFIGDVHGNFNRYHKFCRKLPESIQLGDMGVGFQKEYSETLSKPKKEKIEHKFICGNHDNYKYASKLPNCLKRYGYIEDRGIFYISGGYSIDRVLRTEGVNWWSWEQLDCNEMVECMDLYRKVKPEIVCSHEAPSIAKYRALFYNNKMSKPSSSTERFLNELYLENEPKYWIHGHFHQFYTKQEGDTLFIGLDELLHGKKENCIFEIST